MLRNRPPGGIKLKKCWRKVEKNKRSRVIGDIVTTAADEFGRKLGQEKNYLPLVCCGMMEEERRKEGKIHAIRNRRKKEMIIYEGQREGRLKVGI